MAVFCGQKRSRSGFETFSQEGRSADFRPGNPRETSEEEIAGLYRSLL